jgi:hypothetical protein
MDYASVGAPLCRESLRLSQAFELCAEGIQVGALPFLACLCNIDYSIGEDRMQVS